MVSFIPGQGKLFCSSDWIILLSCSLTTLQNASNPTRKFKLVFIPLPHFARILSVKEEHKTIFMDQFFRGKSGQFPLITTIAGKNRVSWRLHTLASWPDLPSTGSLLTNYVDYSPEILQEAICRSSKNIKSYCRTHIRLACSDKIIWECLRPNHAQSEPNEAILTE